MSSSKESEVLVPAHDVDIGWSPKIVQMFGDYELTTAAISILVINGDADEAQTFQTYTILVHREPCTTNCQQEEEQKKQSGQYVAASGNSSEQQDPRRQQEQQQDVDEQQEQQQDVDEPQDPSWQDDNRREDKAFNQDKIPTTNQNMDDDIEEGLEGSLDQDDNRDVNYQFRWQEGEWQDCESDQRMRTIYVWIAIKITFRLKSATTLMKSLSLLNTVLTKQIIDPTRTKKMTEHNSRYQEM
eukprot:TRINITY_DN2161_c0_g1_i1.p1 TRINITY_DN2161_c0_g1~~TRINITY_DN2161_c0_g1_i1.p1  ORF type:complete len:242 (+),score=45.39 TRINITY_DN2161_c0_g1_i1:381-1106(+)